MNKEICNKCERCPEVYIIQYINEKEVYLKGLKKSDNKEICACYTKHPKQIEKMREYFLFRNKPTIPASEIQNKNFILDKKYCPYYIEHQIYEWNKKEKEK